MDRARTISLAEISTAARQKAADDGAAMPDGSYPIRNTRDLRNAILAFGRAKDPAAVKAHIIKRAKALGAASMLPDTWDATAPLAQVIDLARKQKLPGVAAKLHGHAQRHRTRAIRMYKAGNLTGARKAWATAKKIDQMAKGTK